jgi:methylated-DNA-[protein]-cysteine S-methyltransferase
VSLSFKLVTSPIGTLKLVASDQGLVAVLWEKERPGRVNLLNLVENPAYPLLLRTEKELNEYFSRTRKSFTVPLDMRGTYFQKQVWEALLGIPFGETRTYGQLAEWFKAPVC